jgi:hypothetical protein
VCLGRSAKTDELMRRAQPARCSAENEKPGAMAGETQFSILPNLSEVSVRWQEKSYEQGHKEHPAHSGLPLLRTGGRQTVRSALAAGTACATLSAMQLSFPRPAGNAQQFHRFQRCHAACEVHGDQAPNCQRLRGSSGSISRAASLNLSAVPSANAKAQATETGERHRAG